MQREWRQEGEGEAGPGGGEDKRGKGTWDREGEGTPEGRQAVPPTPGLDHLSDASGRFLGQAALQASGSLRGPINLPCVEPRM